jgi:hypothetical protein
VLAGAHAVDDAERLDGASFGRALALDDDALVARPERRLLARLLPTAHRWMRLRWSLLSNSCWIWRGTAAPPLVHDMMAIGDLGVSHDLLNEPAKVPIVDL